MAEKGARARLEPIAMQLYVDGQTLDAIAAVLDVSRQSLSDWKARTRRPGEDFDAWDKAREQRQSTGRRLKNLLERELTFAEEADAGKIGPATLDGISKLGALVQRFEQSEREAALKSTAQRAALFLDFVRDLIEYGSRNDPELLRTVEGNFDDLITWGREKYSGN
jgi:transposase